MGLGFVGLTTALGFCEKTNSKVYGIEKDSKRREALKANEIPFFEPGLLEALLKYNKKNFIITDVSFEAISASNIIFICVGTPCDDNGKADLSYLKNAVIEILDSKKDSAPFTIVIKSTVPPKTTSDFVASICDEKGFKVGVDVKLCSNPEFLREGKSWEDFVNPDRIVIGGVCENCADDLIETYKPFNAPVILVSANTAEFIKYSSNTLLATMISFSNELSMIADSIGDIDIKKAFDTLHMDKRWGSPAVNMASYVYPGCGFGGYCLPKDTQALIGCAENNGYNSKLLKEVLQTNSLISSHIADKIIAAATNKKVGIFGLSFKAESDDVRNTPTKIIIEKLIACGIEVFAYDPMANAAFNNEHNLDIIYCETADELLSKVDTVAILTGWKEFKGYDFTGKIVIDGRYLLD